MWSLFAFQALGAVVVAAWTCTMNVYLSVCLDIDHQCLSVCLPASQVLGAVVVAAWTCTINGILWSVLRAMGWLRVSEQMEIAGLDIAQGTGTGTIGFGFFRGHSSDKD
jgi:Ammonium Transporter Family